MFKEKFQIFNQEMILIPFFTKSKYMTDIGQKGLNFDRGYFMRH